MVWSLYLEGRGLTLRTMSEIRLQNLNILINEIWFGSQTEAARQLDCTSGYISNLCNQNKGIGSKTARKIEKAAGKPVGWLDSEHSYDMIFAKIKLLNHSNRAAVKLFVDQLIADQSDE